MQDYTPYHPDPSKPAPSRPKRIGGYLVEAGLLTPSQVAVALNDQKQTGMRFGEILAARGWVKQETIEYFMQQVILPEQQATQREHQPADAQPMPHQNQIEDLPHEIVVPNDIGSPIQQVSIPTNSLVGVDEQVSQVG